MSLGGEKVEWDAAGGVACSWLFLAVPAFVFSWRNVGRNATVHHHWLHNWDYLHKRGKHLCTAGRCFLMCSVVVLSCLGEASCVRRLAASQTESAAWWLTACTYKILLQQCRSGCVVTTNHVGWGGKRFTEVNSGQQSANPFSSRLFLQFVICFTFLCQCISAEYRSFDKELAICRGPEMQITEFYLQELGKKIPGTVALARMERRVP